MEDITLSVNGKEKGKGSKKNNQKLLKKHNHSFEIYSAKIKERKCNYTFSITEGVGIGDGGNIEGNGIVKPSLIKAFADFNQHLACIDDAYATAGIERDYGFFVEGQEIGNIDQLKGHELTTNYQVTGFTISGGRDNERIVLYGTKWISKSNERMEIKTPKYTIDQNSSYKWYNELKTAADNAREEVSKYREGNYDLAIDEAKDPAQLTIADMNNKAEASTDGGEDDFTKAKV